MRSSQVRDFCHQRVDDIGLIHFTQNLAALEHDAGTGAACNAYIGITGFSGTVDHAAHNRNLHRSDDGLQALLDLLGKADEVNLASTTSRTADDLGAASAKVERGEEGPACSYLVYRIVCQGNAHGVADALFEENAKATR